MEEIRDSELTKEELTERLSKAEEKITELTEQLLEMKQGQAALQSTVIRLAMKFVGTL